MIFCEIDRETLSCKVCGGRVSAANVFRACRATKPASHQPDAATLSGGPGTELKTLLAGWPLYLTSSPDCACNARAAEMDRQGVEWCEANIDTIVGWLREQAEARGLPFLDVAGRLLVRRAIRNARRLR